MNHDAWIFSVYRVVILHCILRYSSRLKGIPVNLIPRFSGKAIFTNKQITRIICFLEAVLNCHSELPETEYRSGLKSTRNLSPLKQ